MAKYVIRTDAFMADELEADNLDDAIDEAFSGEGMGIHNLATLERKFAKYVDDGGWCWIDEDGERIVEIGTIG